MLNYAQKERILEGMTYPEYSGYTRDQIKKNKFYDKTKCELLRLNSVRSARIEKTFEPDPDLSGLIKEINSRQIWLVISEPWCGDSAQNIPYFALTASLNPLIDLRVILRDSNPDIMDMFLTNGARSIPVIIIFDENFNELTRWGSRPQHAKNLVTGMKAANKSKEEMNQKLHSWYALNKGKEVTSEICEILRNVLTTEML